MSSTLNAAALDKALAILGMKPAPAHRIMVVRPAVSSALRRETTPTAVGIPDFLGTPVFEKADQVADCYAFKNREDADKYLNGEVTELDLIRFKASNAETLADFLADRIASASDQP